MQYTDLKHILLDSKSWSELHSRLAVRHFSYVQKGGGAVIRGPFSTGETEIKASTIANSASLKKLERSLGPFQEHFEEEYTISPDSPDIIMADHEKMKALLKEERIKIHDIIMDIDKDLNLKQSEIATLKQIVSPYHKNQLDFLVKSYNEKFEKNKQALHSISDFEVWYALNFPKSEISITLPDDVIVDFVPYSNEKYHIKIDAFIKYHAAVNADRYRITVRMENSPSVFVFDKKGEEVSAGNTPSEVLKHIPEMSAREAQFGHVYLTPLSDTRIHILVDDMTPDSLSRMKADGFLPSCVIQSSPQNFQAIFTIPRPVCDHVREAANALSRGLNSRYGDINLSGQEHAHRVPGFCNPKAKYKTSAGTYPVVRLMETNPEPCSRLLDFIAYQVERYAALVARHGNIARTASAKRVQELPLSNGLEAAIYHAHRADILRVNSGSFSENCADMSRIDAMIAERLRATGHAQEEIESILMSGVDRSRNHDLLTYVPLTAAHAFSLDASHRIEGLKRFHTVWAAIEKAVLQQYEEEHVNPEPEAVAEEEGPQLS